MLFDYLTLEAVTQELAKELVGGKVEKVTQPEPLDVVLRIYNRGRTLHLLMSADSASSRVHLTAVRRASPVQLPGFCAILRKYLEGARLEGFDLPCGVGERILHVGFRAADGAKCTLIGEFMARHSNVVLCTDTLRILGAAKVIRAAAEGRRAIQPGATYSAPDRVPQVDPTGRYEAAPAPEFSRSEAIDWLRGTLAGISAVVADEVVCRAGHQSLTPKRLRPIVRDLFAGVRDGVLSPRLWTDDNGATLGAYPVALCSVTEKNQHPLASISVALDTAAQSIQARSSLENGRKQLLTALIRDRLSRQRECAEIEKGLLNAAKADEYRESAELLLAVRPEVPEGAEFVELPDYYAPLTDTGAYPNRRIAMDPAIGLQENIERYFRRSRKARDAAVQLALRRERALLEVGRLAACEQSAATAVSLDALDGIRAEAGLRGGGSAKQKPEGAATFPGHKIRTFRSAQGWEILVGENATSNDFLTTKVAGPNDIWLHVRAAASAHGVIRTLNKPETVPPETVKEAAELVAARSEVKHSSIVPVDYTLKKYVRKPRRSAPGAVFYQNEKTIAVGGIHEGDGD